MRIRVHPMVYGLLNRKLSAITIWSWETAPVVVPMPPFEASRGRVRADGGRRRPRRVVVESGQFGPSARVPTHRGGPSANVAGKNAPSLSHSLVEARGRPTGRRFTPGHAMSRWRDAMMRVARRRQSSAAAAALAGSFSSPSGLRNRRRSAIRRCSAGLALPSSLISPPDGSSWFSWS